MGEKDFEPVNGAGRYACEHGNCNVSQDDDDTGDVLFYGKDDGMYCKNHIEKHI